MELKNKKSTCDVYELPEVFIKCGSLPFKEDLNKIKNQEIETIIDYYEDELKNHYHDRLNCKSENNHYYFYIEGIKKALSMIYDEEIKVNQ
jgi:hypothetical protein